MLCRGVLLQLAALLLLPALAGVAQCEVLVVGDGGEVGEVREVVGPQFSPQQVTAVVAPLGHSAVLACTVLHLRDKAVSWVRSRDLQILSHAGVVFTADARVSATSHPATGTHELRIEQLRAADQGRYECQLNTEPKMSLFYNLTVVDEEVPVVEVSAEGGAVVEGVEGGSATLSCSARYVPAPRLLPLAPLDVRWARAGGEQLGPRGAVALDTQRWAARALARLTLGELRRSDAGRYVCSAAHHALTVTLRVRPAESNAEAMQRDEGAGGGSPHRAPAPLALLLLLPLLLLPR